MIQERGNVTAEAARVAMTLSVFMMVCQYCSHGAPLDLGPRLSAAAWGMGAIGESLSVVRLCCLDLPPWWKRAILCFRGGFTAFLLMVSTPAAVILVPPLTTTVIVLLLEERPEAESHPGTGASPPPMWRCAPAA